MNDKPDLKLIEAAASDDPFDLSRLRINPEMLETTGVKEIADDGAGAQAARSGFRPRPARAALSGNARLHRIQGDRETYIVDLGAVPELQGECFFATLFVAISRTGVLFMWPVKVPSRRQDHEWHTSAAMAAQYAMKSWVRVKSNMDLGAYEIFEAAGSIPDPIWPDLSFDEIVRIAFKDRVIREPDHPVVKRLRGG